MNLVTEPIKLSNVFYNPNKNPDDSEHDYRDYLIFFDLETSGLCSIKDEIIQIAAKSGAPGGKPFNLYCKPRRGISEEASRVNKLTFRQRTMRYKGVIVKSKPIKKALEEFVSYLESIPLKKLILVAHNVTFDASFLVHNLTKYK